MADNIPNNTINQANKEIHIKELNPAIWCHIYTVFHFNKKIKNFPLIIKYSFIGA